MGIAEKRIQDPRIEVTEGSPRNFLYGQKLKPRRSLLLGFLHMPCPSFSQFQRHRLSDQSLAHCFVLFSHNFRCQPWLANETEAPTGQRADGCFMMAVFMLTELPKVGVPPDLFPEAALCY